MANLMYLIMKLRAFYYYNLDYNNNNNNNNIVIYNLDYYYRYILTNM
jgi:hypothetical protein